MADNRGAPVLGLRERKKLRTRATLIDAAVGLCDRQGFDGTTVDQIAAIADVSPRTFSRYFATKDAIALALIDEVLDHTAAQLARQPAEIDHFEAMRRAYIAMAEATKTAPVGGFTSARLLQILRIVVTSSALRHAAIEYRANPVDAVVAQRMGTTVDDRRVKLVAAVWGGLLMTALQDATRDLTDAVSITVDDLIDAFEATYTDFVGQIAPLRQLV
ncbi:TetR family transcriptional regulator [Mycolicibacterium sp. OfavD-34-C]|uniref:TetR family transcriptional regulator n=1 Tax=Mycolicibacterium sp. OfavD-34-C TaxID=2917746 RepID=UPI001EF5C0D4|nr:TetR family transcriptional regulator [Mycolicibacterium sp. OfavD-34-C]MCG7582884.1 TetR/AcrR family transcriptional regulator [Mycolicibacterium sp. OfavD-34-C]